MSQSKFDPQLSFEMINGSINSEIEIEETPFRMELFGLTDHARYSVLPKHSR